MNKLIAVLFCGMWLISVKAHAQNAPKLSLIPYPQSLQEQTGTYRLTGRDLTIYTADKAAFANEVAYLKKVVFPGRAVAATSSSVATVSLLKDMSLKADAYRLEISAAGIKIAASASAGLFSGIQTLRQLLMLPGAGAVLPYVKITDQPAFKWRGVELDVARHFFSKSYLFRFIDLLAFYKMNTLHLHLSDDQGWRLEIKKFPKLTETGAWREYNDHDSACLSRVKENPDFALEKENLITRNGKTLYGGFYTQADMKEIIAYAASRHIEIVPEIDMPGHMMVATKAYPELLDGNAGWGQTFSIPLNPAKKVVYDFVEGVLSEVIALFPSKYVHIGADEVEKTSWENSPACKELMAREGIKDMHALQSYFVNKVNRFVRSKGKTAIGWDEVLDGGVDANMTIMYWRGWVKDSPYKAVTGNHQLIMTPTNPLYFDYAQNKGTLAQVYDLKVVAPDIPADKAYLVQGAQGNVWTEYIPSIARLEFMLLPRMTALSERVWTNKELYGSYRNRLPDHFTMLDNMGYKYRLPDLEGFSDEQLILDGRSELTIQNPLKSASVHYTLDGSAPEKSSPLYTGKINITRPLTASFASFSAKGARSEVYQVRFRASKWHPGETVQGVKPGLKASFYKGSFKNTKEINGSPLREEVLANVHVSDTVKLPAFGLKLRGYLNIPEDGIYNFFFTCDDGGVLRINDEMVVDNDGLHSAQLKSGQTALKRGLHPFAIDFIEGGGGFVLKLQYAVKGSDPKPVPDSWFVHH